MLKHGLLVTLGLLVLLRPAAPAAHSDTALTDAEITRFLLTARVIRTRDTQKGITRSLRATLSDGTLTHDAHIQTIEQTKAQFQGPNTIELNFRDSWQFNVAAYQI